MFSFFVRIISTKCCAIGRLFDFLLLCSLFVGLSNPWQASARSEMKASDGLRLQSLVWMERMDLRAAASGSGKRNSRSKRPGRRSAGSIESRRFVAPITITCSKREFKVLGMLVHYCRHIMTKPVSWCVRIAEHRECKEFHR